MHKCGQRKMFEILLLLSFYGSISCEAFNHSTAILSSRDSGGGWGSGTGVHSFFDIALTALAFLSFGIFLLNLLLNALLFTSGLTTGLTSTGPIITNTGTVTTGGSSGGTGGTTGGGGGGGGGAAAARNLFGGGKRNKRSTAQFGVSSVVASEVLARTVIKSIDAMILKHECLPMMFCEGNKRARVIGHGFQYLMPLYSFSSSYVGERLGFHHDLPIHLDAILHGVGEANCLSRFKRC